MNRPEPGLDDSPSLDDDIVARLDEGLQAEAPDIDLAARVKRRVLRRIADEETPRHVTLQPEQDTWKAFGKGITIKVLNEDAGIMSCLVRMAPGSSLPPHRHPVDEECVVLEGSVFIGDLTVRAGGFHLGRKDVLHARLGTVEVALIYLRGASPSLELVL